MRLCKRDLRASRAPGSCIFGRRAPRRPASMAERRSRGTGGWSSRPSRRALGAVALAQFTGTRHGFFPVLAKVGDAQFLAAPYGPISRRRCEDGSGDESR